jgi:O6-methylguanine-DNA--protein-cysteine methyltransferase
VPRGRRAAAPSDAQEILQQLIHEGRISVQDVDRYRRIRELERQLAALRGGTGGARRRGRPPGGGARAQSSSSSALTSEQRASRQLQGRYLALVRRIPAGKRGRFAQIVKEKGREAAIRAMQSEVGGAAKAPSKAGGGKRRRRSGKLTSEQLASRQLQGRYLGLIRQVPASQRARYKKIVKEKGREAAIKELQSAVK